MKKTFEIPRKSERIKEYDQEVLKDLKFLFGSKTWKTHLKKLHKKKKPKAPSNSSQLDGVLGLASLLREAAQVPIRAATHVSIASSILKQLTKSPQIQS